MGVKWPLLLVPLLVLAGVAVWLALRRSNYGWQGQLPYFARAQRLTELPEYRRALKRYERLLAAALAMVCVVVLTMAVAVTRPVRSIAADDPDSNTPFVDIMMCFGQSNNFVLGDRAGIGPLMDSLRAEVEAFGNQRIGMTNGFYRAFPITDDYEWVDKRFESLSAMAEELDSPDATARFSVDTDAFERDTAARINGGAPNTNDTLAMCAMGFPAVGADNGRGRLIVFVGNPDYGEEQSDARIYSDDLVRDTIETAGIRVSSIVPAQVGGPMGLLESLVRDTGGRHVQYTPIDILEESPSTELQQNLRDELSGAVESIFADPPPGALDATLTRGRFQWDIPEWPLRMALFAAVALAACRLGMRL